MHLVLVILPFLRLSRRRRRLAGAEHGSRVSQGALNLRCDGVRRTDVTGAVGREVAAAAELGVLRHAAHAVLVTGSTFSEVAMRWRTQSNQSAPVVVRLS